jgi:hypothetical protein
VQSGFSLPFLGTILLYIVSVYLYWSYFLRKKDIFSDQAANLA